MATKLRGLGRGLDALLPDHSADNSGSSQTLALTVIRAGKYQPRNSMAQEPLDELAQSIRAHGVMQPILVRPIQAEGEVRYEIIAGERRYRAAKLAGLSDIPVLIKESDDQQSAVMALIENMQRADLNPIEEARGMARLTLEFSLTHEQVAQTLGKSRSAVSNSLRLMQLAPSVQEWLASSALEMGHARTLITLDSGEQVQWAQKIMLNQWSVRQTEEQLRQHKKNPPPAAPRKAPATAASQSNNELDRLAEQLSDRLALPIALSQHPKGLHLSAYFSDREALEQFIARVLTQ